MGILEFVLSILGTAVIHDKRGVAFREVQMNCLILENSFREEKSIPEDLTCC